MGSRVRFWLIVTGFWTFAAIVGLTLAGLPFLWWQGGTLELEIAPTRIRPVGGASYKVKIWPNIEPSSLYGWLPDRGPSRFFFDAPPDSDGEFHSTLELYEDETRLGPAHSGVSEIRREGLGRFSHQADWVIFSTSDNSDPRINGRRYSIRRFSRPLLGPIRIGILAVFWLASVGLLGFSVMRWRRLIGLIKRSRADNPDALLVLFVVGGFTLYAFFFSLPVRRFALEYLAFLAVPSALFLLVSRRRLVVRLWMIWPSVFLAYSAGSALIHPYASWMSVQDLLVSSSLGIVILSAMHHGLKSRRGSPALLLLAFSQLLAVAILVQNLGLDLKGLVAGLDGLDFLPWQHTRWNQKYEETWLLILTWSALAAVAPRSRRGWMVAGTALVLTGVAILSGYSHSAKVAYLLGVAVFIASLITPRAVRRGLTLVVMGSFLLMPIVSEYLWQYSFERNSSVASSQGAAGRLARRVVIWKHGTELIAERPWLGWGLGACKNLPGNSQPAGSLMAEGARLPAIDARQPPLRGGHPHSLQMQIWIETGAIGVVLAMGLFLAWFRRFVVFQTKARRPALLALVASLVFMFGLNYPAWDPPIQMLIIMTAGLAQAIGSTPPHPERLRTGLFARRRSLSWRVRLLLVLASTLLVVFVVELALRASGVDSSPGGSWRYHPDLGWVQTPGHSYEYLVTGEPVRVEYNSLGFRDTEHSIVKPNGHKRVVIIGDSFTAAVEVNFEDTFGSVLSSLLNEGSSEQWEVISLGVGDFGTAQERLALELYGLAYDPDVVVHQIFPLDDICNNSIALFGLCKSDQDGFRPYFVLEDGKLEIGAAQPVRSWLRRRSFLYRLLVTRGLRGQIPEGEYRHRLEEAGLPAESPLLHAFVPDAMQIAGVSKGWAATEATIEDIAMVCRQNGIGYLPVVIPFKSRIQPEWESFSARRPIAMVRDYPEQRLGRLFQRLGTPGVMMIEALDEIPRVAQSSRGGRLNPEGHELVAIGIYEEMVAAGYVASDPSAVAHVGRIRDGINSRFTSSGGEVLFTAAENPIRLCDGTGLAETELTWNTGSPVPIEVRIGSPSGALFAAGSGISAQRTGKWVTDGMTFYLQDTRKESETNATLATLTLEVNDAGCR